MQKAKRSRIKQSWEDTLFDGVVYALLILVTLIVAYPLIYVVSASFSSTQAVMSGRVVFLPVEPTTYAYQAVFRNQQIMVGYRNSFIYTLVGTVINLVMCLLAAFPLSRKNLAGRQVINLLFVFTMFFSGGLVPTYNVVANTLHLNNTIWAMVLPGALNVWYMILLRTYIQNSISEELIEAAELDGCNVYRMLFQIIVPLSTPILAVVGLYCAVGIWSSYFDALIYLTKANMMPLQVILRDILILNKVDPSMIVDAREMAMRQGLINLLKYAVIVVASAPLLVIYPFVQKHFVKGIMIGSVKG